MVTRAQRQEQVTFPKLPGPCVGGAVRVWAELCGTGCFSKASLLQGWRSSGRGAFPSSRLPRLAGCS